MHEAKLAPKRRKQAHLVHGWHHVSVELIGCVRTLMEIRRKDEGMTTQIKSERFAQPSTHCLDTIKWYSLKKVVEHATDTETVAFEVGQAILLD